MLPEALEGISVAGFETSATDFFLLPEALEGISVAGFENLSHRFFPVA